jgi:PAS domain S-box-containing protein
MAIAFPGCANAGQRRGMKTMNRVAVVSCNFIAAFMTICLLVATGVYARQGSTQKVLILNSYHKEFKWTDAQVSAAKEALTEGIGNLELFVEYMDTKRIYNNEYLKHLFNIYHLKYKKIQLDAIITTDDNALWFAVKYHKRIFNEAPVSFCGINDYRKSLLEGRQQFTGLVEVLDIKPTIDLALRLHPGTRKIVVVVDSTPTGLGQIRDVAVIARQYNNLKFEYLEGKDISHAELFERLRSLPQDSIVLLAVWLRDKNDVYLSSDEGGPLISSNSTVPVYGIIDMYYGSGIVGGKLLNSRTHGRIAAETALRIIKGEKPVNIPVIFESTNPYMFDYKQLERWGVSLSDLPKDSIIFNKPFSFYEEYKRLIWSVIGIFVFLVSVVAFLTMNVVRRRKAEETLRESEERFRSLVQTAVSVILSLSPDHRIVEFNPEAERLYGRKREDVLGKDYLELFIPEEERDAVAADMKKVLAGEPTKGFENEVIAHDGSEHVLIWNVNRLLDSKGQPKGIIAVGQDITDRKRMEGALRESEEKYRLLVENIPSVTWVTSEQGKTTFISPNVEKIFGYSQEEIYEGGDSIWFGRIHPDDTELVRESFEMMFTKKQRFDAEYRIQRKDGEWIWLHDMAIMAFEKDNIRYAHGIFSDITERKRAEEEREKLISELEAKNAELERFTYTVSHDLKSPLITIKGFLGMLEKDTAKGDTERMKDDIGRISDAADKMNALLQELLELSRIGRMINPPEEVPFGDLVREAMETLAGRLAERNIQVDIAPDLPMIYGDALRILEVLENLIDNAVKFMGDEANPLIEIGAREDDGETVFFVRDNGVGIDPKYHDKIFGLFDKLDPKSEGTGVGMAIVKRIIEVHGGLIWIESDGAGTGSTFCFNIPDENRQTREPLDEKKTIL